MRLFFKRILKIGLWAFLLLLAAIAIFVAFNFTLVKNLPSSQKGGFDAYYIANQSPLQIVKGDERNELKVMPLSEISLRAAHDNWADTGGKALLVWHNGELVYEVYADGITPDQRTKSFSLHKSVLGLVAATMEAEGLIKLDTPVSDYVDAYKKGGRENLTIRQLLQHEGGIERFSFNPPSLGTLNLLLSDKVEKTAVNAKLVSDDLLFDYSNVQYQVAGAAIRAALKQETSQTYAEYLSERLWKPLGAQDAFLWAETEEGAPRFYSGLQASPRDWLKLGVLIAENDGTILPKPAIETLLRPSVLNPNYGLGVWLGDSENGVRSYGPSTAMKVKSAEPFKVSDMVFFDGFGGQRVYISQKEKLVIVRVGDVRFDWDDTALPNLITTALEISPSYYDQTLTLKGENEREIPVRFLSQDMSCKLCSLVIISHGAFAGSHDYDAVAMPFVEQGYHVAIPVHPDSKSHPIHASFSPKDYTKLRIEDHQLIMKHVANSNSENIEWVSLGHSYGAMIATIFAGASSNDNLLSESALGLPSHAIALSPPGAIPTLFSREQFAKLESPTLIITGTEDIVPNMIEDWEDHLDLYRGAPKGKATALVFDGQDHYFNGLYGRPTGRAHEPADEMLVSLMLAFLNDEPLASGESYKVLQ